MRWAGWIGEAQAVSIDESQLRAPAEAAARAGTVARRAAADLPFGASPVDFAGEFARLVREGSRR